LLCLFTSTVAESGERKSAVQQAMTAPLLDVEQQLVEDGENDRLEAQTALSVATMAAEKLRRAAASADADNREAMLSEAVMAARMVDAIKVPVIPRLIADDITPEAAASLIAEQSGRLAIISAEGGLFDIIAGRYNGNVPNLDLWLKGHSGDPVRIDRKGRSPEYIRRPALTLGLMIQPEVLRVIAAQRQFRGRGLLARFLYALPPSKVGRRQTAAPPVPDDVANAYGTTIHDLAVGMTGWLSDPAVLTLTPKAQEAIQMVEAAVEPSLADGGELAALKDWGSKYTGTVARLAGIIHLTEHGADSGPMTPVSAETIHKASRIGTYFKASAIGAFLQMGADPGTVDAVYLLDRIKHLGLDVASERMLHRACQSRFQKKDALMAAVDRLVDHGYLIPLAQQKTGGRPASPTYRVHGSVKQ
jgi:replicative DNA helicase